MTVAETIALCKKTLAEHYEAQFRGILLYGSTAREQATPKSDIELLVLLDRPFDYFAELRRIVNLLYPIQMESDRLIYAALEPVGTAIQSAAEFVAAIQLLLKTDRDASQSDDLEP